MARSGTQQQSATQSIGHAYQTDLDRLRRIAELVAAGLNLAGVAMVLDLQDQNARLRRRLGLPHDDEDEPSR